MRSEEIARRVVSEAAFWSNMDIFAKDLGISGDTLYRHYRDELDDGRARKVAQVAARMFKAAMNGNAASMKAWLAAHGGPDWSPRIKHEVAGRGGRPVEVVDVGNLVEGKSSSEISAIISAIDTLIAVGLAESDEPGILEGDTDPFAGEAG